MYKEYLLASKYPFTSFAREFLRKHAKDYISDAMLEKALNRIRRAVSGDRSFSEPLHERQALEEVVCYAVSRMMLSCLKDRHLSGIFAINEAKKALRILQSAGTEEREFVIDDFGFRYKRSDSGVLIHFSTYLKYKPDSNDYALTRRSISGGYVKISEYELLRILQEAIYSRIVSIPNSQVPKKVCEYANRIYDFYRRAAPMRIQASDYPPCIQSLMGDISMHKNLGHHARWTLAVYLIKAGKSDSEIIEIYKNLPDFNEKITSYHIRHARSKNYSVPNCETIRSYGLCVADCGIKNPLGWKKSRLYGRWKLEK